MIKKSELLEVIEYQRYNIDKSDSGHKRSILDKLSIPKDEYALIISGIRRCGKSTLLHQLIEKVNDRYIYINFDTARLYNFEMSDFVLLDEIIDESGCTLIFFDEIQVVKGWELYVRQKLDEKFRIVITGSNASLLSKELGTKLTGRHITKELFPFSYAEFCSFLKLSNGTDAFAKYSEQGGFPNYLKTENVEIHTTLMDDILYRDVAVRHNIRDIGSLKKLLLYLASNIGNLVSATKLTHILGIKSPATVLEYLGFFEQSYLIQLVPKFSYSYKVQIVNPRKVYFIDSGLQGAITSSFNKDIGRKLENIAFWELRRLGKEMFYYNENNKECDFVVCHNNKVENLIQVCFELNVENEEREILGLFDAMNFFKIGRGIILTNNQQDVILNKDKRIDVIPAYQYFSS